MSDPLLAVEDLTIRYDTDAGPITAVSDASFTVERGEFAGLAGESGCGKSTLAAAVIGGLDPNGRIASGTIRYQGEEIQDFSERELNRSIRWKEISFIPQSSMNSLDPLERIDKQVVQIAKTHTELSRRAALDEFADAMEIMGIPRNRISDYPHQFSGGMQQRVVMALAIFLDPDLIIADEPTTALDVIVQDQIFRYLKRIKEETDISMLLITHDISVIFEFCDRVSIMHAGQVCESGAVTDIYDDPRHPYTILLQEAFPDIRYPNRTLETIEGHPPRLNTADVDYCTFADRCPWAVEECRASAPPLDPVDGDDGHTASCFRKHEVHELYDGRADADAGRPGGTGRTDGGVE